MDYLKIDPRLFDRPEWFRVGWYTRQVYLGLLFVSAKYDMMGVLPPKSETMTEWLAKEMGVDQEEKGALPMAIDHLVEMSHLTPGPEGKTLVITKWNELYTPKDPTAAARQDRHRKKVARLLNAGTVTHGTQPNPTQLNTTQHPQTPVTGGDDATGFDGEKLADIWNKYAPVGCPRVLQLAGQRATHAEARAAEDSLIPGLSRPDFWRTVVQMIAPLDWMVGKGARKWFCTFDYLIRPGTAAKILEQSQSLQETPGQTRKVDPSEDLYGGEG